MSNCRSPSTAPAAVSPSLRLLDALKSKLCRGLVAQVGPEGQAESSARSSPATCSHVMPAASEGHHGRMLRCVEVPHRVEQRHDPGGAGSGEARFLSAQSDGMAQVSGASRLTKSRPGAWVRAGVLRQLTKMRLKWWPEILLAGLSLGIPSLPLLAHRPTVQLPVEGPLGFMDGLTC